MSVSIPGLSLRSNPGLELVNAFGVYNHLYQGIGREYLRIIDFSPPTLVFCQRNEQYADFNC